MRISCEHVSKNFQVNGRLCILDDINLETEDHDFICILGPNGCGKTTLLKIMAGIFKPTKGKVSYSNVNGGEAPVTLIFQERELFPWLTAIDNICFSLEMRGIPKSVRYKKAEEYIAKMGLGKFVHHYPHQLSAGMKQKVSLIRGLLTESLVLLIDEPDTSLDIYTKLIVQQDIYNIWNESQKTIICVSHDIDAALRSANNIWIMGRCPGRIIKKINLSEYRTSALSILELKDEIFAIINNEAQKVY